MALAHHASKFYNKIYSSCRAALLTLAYAVYILPGNTMLGIALLIAALAIALLIFYHSKLLATTSLKTSLFFLVESLVLTIIAWQLYKQGYNKATFFYEGFSVFYLSLCAFGILLRKKRHVLFGDDVMKDN